MNLTWRIWLQSYDLTILLTGRDTALEEGEFEQYVFLGTVPPGAVGEHGVSVKTLINSYPSATLGRFTEEKVFTFHFRMIRDPLPLDCQ